jgi:HAD superfamily hydrolase (TIGR01509 family)
VLFDFGGTLCTFATVETAARINALQLARMLEIDPGAPLFESIRAGMRRAFAEYGPRPYFLHRELMRDGYRWGLAEFGAEVADEQLLPLIAGFWENVRDSFELREGVIETLDALRGRGLAVGVVSNSDGDELNLGLDMAGLPSHLDFALSSEAARSCKPDGGIFAEALRRAGCAPVEALFVGDTPDHDVLGANRAGLISVLLRPEERLGLPWPRGESQPRHVIRAIPEVLELLG